MIPDYRKDATIVYRFTTRDAEGEPTTLSGSPTIAVYKEGSTSEVTTGLTLTADYDGVTGLNQIAIVTTDAFYEADKDYAIVLTAGTVDSVAVSGEVVHQFSLEKQTIADVSGLSTLDAQGIRDAVGLAAADLDTQLGDIATAVGDIGAGEGDYTITVAVDDGDDDIEGARVTAIQNGVQQAVGVTNSDGEAVIALDAGTYTFTVSAGGFLSAVTTHTVTAVSSTHEVPVSLTGITISPSQPGNITVFFTVFKDGLPAPGVAIPVQLKSTTNIGGFATQPQTVITDGNGVGQLVDALTDTTYSIRGVDFTTPSSGASFEVPTPFYL
jgi:hypothetical protein